MPYIYFAGYAGRDEETVKKTMDALVDAAISAWGAPREAFTVVYEPVPKEEWESKVAKPLIEPKRDKVIIDHGAFVGKSG